MYRYITKENCAPFYSRLGAGPNKMGIKKEKINNGNDRKWPFRKFRWFERSIGFSEGNREIRDEREGRIPSQRNEGDLVDCAVVAKILLQKLEKLTSPSVSLRRPFAQCHY